jgi:thiosulfate/3-mercaptopyruvate sulfurtransferase
VLRLPGPLVTVDWLHRSLGDPSLRIADVRWALSGPPGRERYDAGHLPGAVFLDVDTELATPGAPTDGRHPLPSAAHLAEALGTHGIGDEHVVVAYDDASGSIAARLWWLFRHFGRGSACAVLDGGIAAWADAGLPLTTDEPSHPPATWTPRAARDDVADADAVAAADERTLLLDARAAERYRGEIEPIDPRAGHVPGAVSAPWTGNIGPDGRFLSADALRARFGELGVEGREVVAYCGSGINATHDLLALELAGMGDGRLFAGSWSAWSSDPARPAATGPRP